jgi:hypothetical protein
MMEASSKDGLLQKSRAKVLAILKLRLEIFKECRADGRVKKTEETLAAIQE